MNEQDKIISEASSWAVRVEAGLSGADQDAFLDWFTADPRHAEEYDRQRANWSRLDILADWRPEHSTRPNRDLLAPRRETLWGWLRKHRRMITGASLGLAGAAACAVLLMVGIFQPTATPPLATPGSAVYAAKDAISTIEQTKLDDGTIVELNRGASITVTYTATERHVKLNHGEVNFNVAKDPSRPFIVNIDGVNVRALGTSFNVRRGGDAVEVLVTSGLVRVDANDGEPAAPSGGQPATQEDSLVKAGQLAVVSFAAQSPSMSVRTVESDKIENMIAWHPRLIDIAEQPLASVVAEFNRRNAPIRIVIADPELAQAEISATLRSDQVENFVRLLEGDSRMKVERDGNQVTLHKKRRG
ncbi:FecR family protein [Ereboglobus luteus]|uniref:FecR protein domain-containing protein n=1 Tax=Ereboglobus luteus TaxID=1796921 RepID=A0A2U8E5W1_9BACT|nr:FecR domain-containing protein [Ereboglobus luteus]AWI10247.1 hypothetical protein CKA38_14190 [Ereboglobus luteus]